MADTAFRVLDPAGGPGPRQPARHNRTAAVGIRRCHSIALELGHVGTGTEYDKTRDSGLTHKEEARRFVEETGVDALAVAEPA